MILAIGLNFREHAIETKQPIPEFPAPAMKSPWVTQNPGDPIVIPTHWKKIKVDYEVELVTIIGKPCKNATLQNALDYVLGYTCGRRHGARLAEKFRRQPMVPRKIVRHFRAARPCIVTKDEIPDPQNLTLKAIVNGEVRQCSNTSDHIFSVAELIVFLSGSTTLPCGHCDLHRHTFRRHFPCPHAPSISPPANYH